MRWSNAFIPTLKEEPQEAEAISHKLMMRAGLIRRLSAGAYTYLPFGYKVLEKATRIVAEEMNKTGAQQILMPALQPAELWKQTGRYDVIGEVMIKFNDRHGREVALGPTHEEVVTDLAKNEVRSYKDLPFTLYQIQTKFRDEVRPRFGIIRSCEFIMKDAYSFDVDVDGMERSYKKMYDAYCRIFERCGLPYVPVEADPGLMGGAVSHEFMIPCEIGEDRIVLCAECKYAASTEVAETVDTHADTANDAPREKMKEISTPNTSTVKDVSAFLGISAEKLVKTLIYFADGRYIAILVRGDHEVNEAKIKKTLNLTNLTMAEKDAVKRVTGGPLGFSGPVGLSGLPVYADFAVKYVRSAVCGSNKADYHIMNVSPGTDFRVDRYFDARTITADDKCPKCGGTIDIKNSIELGHTFKLGTKYTAALNAKFLDKDGKEKLMVMGCYGIGINRILASMVETSNDAFGIIWPVSLAPCEVVVIPLNKDDNDVRTVSENIYNTLAEKRIDVIIDDREKSPGIKFKDSDLVGFPFQIIIGKKFLSQGLVEIKIRKSNISSQVKIDQVIDKVLEYVRG
ncbi:MAG: proline--tRNA ligase [Candidatus Omnitrophica bacterium]|nr:proline--tRNA ligase [Candidatus Omnitrophota bacterium]